MLIHRNRTVRSTSGTRRLSVALSRHYNIIIEIKKTYISSTTKSFAILWFILCYWFLSQRLSIHVGKYA